MPVIDWTPEPDDDWTVLAMDAMCFHAARQALIRAQEATKEWTKNYFDGARGVRV